jgi:hypothetical protein
VSLVEDFYEPWEEPIKNFDQINSIITDIFQRRIAEGRQFAWRGVADASWPLHSSLYRRLLWTRDRGHEKLPTGGHLIPHPSGLGSTVRCSCTVDCREGAREERKDAGGDHRFV